MCLGKIYRRIASFVNKPPPKAPIGSARGQDTNKNATRLQRLADLRNEPIDTVRNRFGPLLDTLPSFSKYTSMLPALPIAASGVEEGRAWIRLKNGRIFYGYLSRSNHRQAFKFFKDQVPDGINEDTFLLGLDVCHRYISGKPCPWETGLPLPDKPKYIVECGAYLGHKTIRFAERVAEANGQMLAIEMMPDNVEILKKNIEANGLQSVVKVIQAGVWSEPGSMPIRGAGRQRNSLLEIKNITEFRNVDVRVDSLDNLIGEWDVEANAIDLVYITVNGAELEALRGLDAAAPRVNALFVVAHYHAEGGRSSAEVCREILGNRGYTLYSSPHGAHVLAAR